MLIDRLRARWFRRDRYRAARAFFDRDWYLSSYPDVRRSGRDPFAHYMTKGWREGRNPHPLFDTAYYLDGNDDVRLAGVNPLVHFLSNGWREDRDSHPLFSLDWYNEKNPGVRASGLNPLLHYIERGAAAGRDPHPQFEAATYLAGLADPDEARAQPLLHYLARNKDAVAALAAQMARRPKTARHIAAHFKHVVALAAAEEAATPAMTGAAAGAPLVSFVVPVYNTAPGYLDDLMASFERQRPMPCTLVLSDDGSSSSRTRAWLRKHEGAPGVTVVWNAVNGGIASATNAGLARATGTWIGLLDHDDALAPFAVSRIARALAAHPACQFLYTDEVIADGKLRPVHYFLKPAWDEALLSGVNYVNHLSLYRRERLLALGGLREGFQGSQDYELLLRYTAGLADDAILHLPYPAYLWRRDGASYSARFIEASTASARRALAAHYGRDGQEAVVGEALTNDLHRVRFDHGRADWPLVTVVVPSRDAAALITQVLDGLTARTDYPALEIVVVDNGSTDPAVLALYDRLRAGPIPFQAHVAVEPFNFSRAVNRGVGLARGAFVLLLNNDIEITEPGWLKEMVSCFAYPQTGIVGAKLLFPDGTIQHMGVIAGLGGLAGHWFIGRPADHPGPQGRFRVRQSLSVVTGACMLVSKACLDAVGPFDEATFPIAYNDVDFCLRAVARGFRVVLTPFATLIHHESASRGSDETAENITRFNRDKRSLRTRHRTDRIEDRAFNPWSSKYHRDALPVLLDRLPEAR